MGWGTDPTHHVSPSTANIPGSLALQAPSWRDPLSPPEPSWASCHQPHLLLGGDKSPRQPSRELSQGRVTASPHSLRGCSVTSGGTRCHLAGPWCQHSAFPAPGHREAALGCGSTISGRQRDKRETHTLTLDQLREREGQNHLPGSDLCQAAALDSFSTAEVVSNCWYVCPSPSVTHRH